MEVSPPYLDTLEGTRSLMIIFLNSWDLHVTSSAHRYVSRSIMTDLYLRFIIFDRIKIYSVNKSRPATAQRLEELNERGIDFNPLTRPLEFTLENLDDYLAAVRKYPREPLS
jgi:sulfite oxidase